MESHDMKRFIFGLIVGISFSSVSTAEGIDKIWTEGTTFGEIRYRLEQVDQENIANNAVANTVRTNLGYKTGEVNGFSGLIEGQFVTHFGEEDFNSLDNNQSTFPVVADPDTAQLNRLWINYSGVPETDIKLGRQHINLDNQRFIGTVGWRQNDQTFDSITLTNNSLEDTTFKYAYIDSVQRIFGGNTPPDELESESHIINIKHNFTDWLNATVYGYFLDFENAAALSTNTYGLRLTGKAPVNDDVKFSYEAEIAHQKDAGDNTADISESYYLLAPKLNINGLGIRVAYEVLGGNGTNAFSTPLATGHKFNG